MIGAAIRTLRRIVRGIWEYGLTPSHAGAYWRSVVRAASNAPLEMVATADALPAVTVSQLQCFKSEIPISIDEYLYVDGGMPLHEMGELCRIVRAVNPATVFEIGTYQGATTLQLAVNSTARIHTLDLPPVEGAKSQYAVWDESLDVYPDRPGIRFHGSSYADRIQQLYGDSRTFDYSPYYGTMEFVLVDACHHYDFVRSDSENSLKLLSERGMIIWHDYAPYAPGVIKYLNELGRELPLVRIAGTSLVVYERRRESSSPAFTRGN